MTSRRRFLAVTGGVVLSSLLKVEAADQVPPTLDHVLLGCSDLEGGIAFVEQHTSLRAAIGGAHPGRGTRNALLSFGGRQYLEIIAPDPKQDSPELARHVEKFKRLTRPALIGWAARVENMDAFAGKLRAAGVKVRGPQPGARTTPDGRTLSWKTLSLEDNYDELLPFFIEWAADTIHPSVDAPAGCRLESFALAHSNALELSARLRQVQLEVLVQRAGEPELRARIAGPKGRFEVSS